MRAVVVLGWMCCGVVAELGCGESSSSSGQTSAAAGTESGGRAEPPTSSGGVGIGGNASGGAGTGGRASGGAATGGRATGGRATGGVMPGNGGAPIQLPDGCMTSHAFTGAGEWSVGIHCGGADYSIYCDDLGESRWGCACEFEDPGYQNERTSYEIEPTTVERAISVTATACLSDDPEFADSPEDCQLASDTTATYCAITEDCLRSKELGGVTVAFKEAVKGYSCVRQGTSTIATCDCGDTDWTFPAVDLTAGCGFARDFCRSKTRTLTRGQDCSVAFEEASDAHCSVSERCDYEVLLDDGTAATATLVDGVSCDAGVGDRPACYCTDHDGRYLTFEFSETPLGIPKCRDANEVCVLMRDHVRHGEFACEESARTATGSTCETLSTCRQPATVGDTPIDLLGTLQIGCERGTDAAWPCTCTSRSADGMTENTADVSVAADDADSACTVAVGECLDRVNVVFAGGLPGQP